MFEETTIITDVTVESVTTTTTLYDSAGVGEIILTEPDAVYQVSVSDTCTVYSGVIPAAPLALARDIVKGYSYDYFFSDLDGDSYFLIIAKGGFDGDTLQGSDCDCYQIDYVDGLQGDFSSVIISKSEYETVTVNNALSLCAYSSVPGYPKLREGGVPYAYAELLLLLVFFASWLVDRIFSHVGNRG